MMLRVRLTNGAQGKKLFGSVMLWYNLMFLRATVPDFALLFFRGKPFLTLDLVVILFDLFIIIIKTFV